MESRPALVIFVHTGDRQYSGTNNQVHIRLYNNEGEASKPITLNKFFSDDMERDSVDMYTVDPSDVDNFDNSVKIESVEVWKSSFLGIISDAWFVHKIVVENTGTNISFVFPFFRWISSGRHFHIGHLDTSLPQHDPFLDQRELELKRKKTEYEYNQAFPNGPVVIKKLPPDEQFSFAYKWDIATTKLSLKTAGKIEAILAGDYGTIEDIKNTFNNDNFERPKNVDSWDLDTNFGRQRIAGLNPSMIRVLQKLPDKFPVTNELLGDLLEDLTIDEAINQNRLFITDHQLMEGIPEKAGSVICKPIGLFYLNNRQNLLPVAIQLFQQPGVDNPIFTPKDDRMLWNFVKMWYNNADAGLHQALEHLGLTHLLMEGFCIATHRNLSPSHPIFKILSPHFLYLLNINMEGLNTLVKEGWVERNMNLSTKGVNDIIKHGFDNWRLDVCGLLPEDLKARGFEDPDILPGYFFRDDGMLLYNSIIDYVRDYVSLYYPSDDVMTEDKEIQAWAAELVKEKRNKNGGCGYKGIPGNGQLTCSDDLVKILTCIIFTCSVTHAAVNFPQYDEYAFPPNYPAAMKGTPPTSKDAVITEKDMIASLPDQDLTLEILTMTTVLSSQGTNALGDFEVQYIFDPKALQIVAKFRKNLEIISEKIQERNRNVPRPYEYLDPNNIPNAISI